MAHVILIERPLEPTKIVGTAIVGRQRRSPANACVWLLVAVELTPHLACNETEDRDARRLYDNFMAATGLK